MSKSCIFAGTQSDGNIIRSEPGLSIAMGQAWQPVLNPKHFDYTEAQQFLETIGDFGSYEDTPAPDERAMARTLRKLTDSQPGGDRLPYSAWRGIGLTGVRALVN